jgi:Tfp pilus assembly protein PilF
MEKAEGVSVLIEPAIKSNDPEWHAKGLLIEYKILTNKYLNSVSDTLEQAELKIRRTVDFKMLVVRDWPITTLVYLAGQANQLQEEKISAQLFRKITESSSKKSASWFAESASSALSAGNYELAAHLFFIARHKEYSPTKQRDYFLAGVRALMTGNFYAQAMLAADLHLDNLSDDTKTLYELIQTARAAGDLSRAAHYAKLLLHLSMLEQANFSNKQLVLSLLGISNADAAEESNHDELIEISPYDQKNYELAYDVFLENHNLSEAYRVAQAAVTQVPEVNIWHQRLAQVAEWFGKPEVALREWRWLLIHHGRHDALLNILRLAPSMNDYDSLIDAWKRVADQQHLDGQQWNKLADLFEQAGRQGEGIEFFQKRYSEDKLPLQLEIAARMAERNGDDDLARSMYFVLLKKNITQPDLIIKIANLYLRKGEYRKAYDLLQSNAGKVDEIDITYYKILADLAWQLQEDENAKKNYTVLANAGKLAREDFSRLIYLLGDAKQEEKAAIAELGFHRFGDRDLMLQALEIYVTRKDFHAQKRLFSDVAADSRLDLTGSARFYLLRAEYFKVTGDFNAARSDFRHAVDIAPDDSNTTNAIFWFFLDIHDETTLRKMINRLVSKGENQNPAYWGVMAATYQFLGQPERAIAYYNRLLQQGGQDFLWLVNYADALDQARHPVKAAQVRRYVWMKLRDSLNDKPFKLPFSQDMLTAARLAMLNYPNDSGLALVGSVLRQDGLLDHDVDADKMTNELVLGWTLSKEQSENAKSWLWRRYGQILNKPLWAEIAIAIAENDTAKIEKLLATQSDGIPMLVRHDAALAVDQKNYAESIVFQGLLDDPEKNDTYQRFAEDELRDASYINYSISQTQLGSLHRIVQSTQIEIPVSPHIRLGAEYWNTHQQNEITTSFGNDPRAETIAGLIVKNTNRFGNSEFGIRRRDEYSTITESHFIHDMKISPQINIQFEAELNAVASESTDLLVLGMRDQLTTQLIYHLSNREYLQIQPGWGRYHLQNGAYLGTGSHISWEFGHFNRTEYPNLNVRLMGSYSGFNSEAGASMTLPENSNFYGVCLGAGESNRFVYSRAWRPYLDYCSTNNDLRGQGYNALLGLLGSALGHDQLSITMSQEAGSANIVNGLSREFKLNYRYYY